MNVERNNGEKLPENLKTVVMAMRAAAGLFFTLGLGGLLFPKTYMNFLGLDDFTLKTTAGVMIFVALINLFVAIPIIIKNSKQAHDND